MSIQLFSALRPRNRIGLVDEEPTREIRDKFPGYELYRCDDAAAAEAGRLATTAALIARQSPKRPRQIAEQLKRLAPAALRNGCLFFVQPPATEPGPDVQRFRHLIVEALRAHKLPAFGLTGDEYRQLGIADIGATPTTLTPLVHVLEAADDWEGVRFYLQLHPPGDGATPGPNVAVRDAQGAEGKLNEEQQLLVQRAFWDSAEVRLEQLRNGLSGVDAYRAYVHKQANQVSGDWPYRYFVKIGPRAKVATEYLKYRDMALEHVPYHLGPRLRLERCSLGHRSGIIVSDYVAGAETLRDCARDGRAVGVLANLFNVTFRAWHNGARPVEVPIQHYLQERLLKDSLPIAVPAFRQPLVAEFGAQKSLDELRNLLIAGDSRPVNVGVIHGDLHATNVLVRDGDAILIDFEKVEIEGLVLRDLACLEGGLFVDGFVGDKRTPASLLASVDCLYTFNELIKGRITPCHPTDGSAWFFDCVAQIRMQARQFECQPGQYALVLASELLRKTCNEVDFDAPTGPDGSGGTPLVPDMPARIRMEQTRAMAYLLGEKVLLEMSSAQASKSDT